MPSFRDVDIFKFLPLPAALGTQDLDKGPYPLLGLRQLLGTAIVPVSEGAKESRRVEVRRKQHLKFALGCVDVHGPPGAVVIRLFAARI